MDKIPAALIVLVCLLLLVRLAVGARRRARLDAVLRQGWEAARSAAVGLWRRPSARRRSKEAAERAIREAMRADATREGNVYRPKSFRRPRKPH